MITIKCIVVGDGGVGKSCLTLRYAEGSFREAHDVTIGVEFASKVTKVRDRPVKVHIWDTAGQESFRAITRSYYRTAAVCLIVYDVTSARSFDSVRRWVRDVQANAQPKVSIVLVANKCDLGERSAGDGASLAAQLGVEYREASARTGEGVEEAFMCAVRAAVVLSIAELPPDTGPPGCRLHAPSAQEARESSCCPS